MKVIHLCRMAPLLVFAAVQANAASVVVPLTTASSLCYNLSQFCFSGITLIPEVPTVTQGDGVTLPVTDQTATSPITLTGSFFVLGVVQPPVVPFGSHAVNIANRPALSAFGRYDLQVTNLDLAAPNLLIRESPTRLSTGQTLITNLGGGDLRIDSFFDIFTELSIDGGQTWIPDDNQNTGTHFESATFVPAPEPGSFLLLCGAGLTLVAARRRR